MTLAAGITIGGRVAPVPGFEVVSYANGAVPRVEKGFARTPDKVSAVVLHTSKGLRSGTLLPGSLASDRAEALARYQASGAREVSWHFTVDTDGTIVQSADPAMWATWHARHANGYSIGIEMVQGDDGNLYQRQIDAAVALVTTLVEAFGIPKITPVNERGEPIATVVQAWQEADEGGAQMRFNGVAGHRNLTTNRGPGDPTDAPFRALLARGFRGVPPTAMTRAEGAPPDRVQYVSAASAASAASTDYATTVLLLLAATAAGAWIVTRQRRPR